MGCIHVFISLLSLPAMRKALIQLHVAVLLAGFTGILGKLITMGEGALVWWRLSLTLIFLGAWLGLRRQLEKIALPLFFKIAAVGFFVAAHWILFYGSIKYSNVSVAVVCFSATGFFTAIFEPLILRKKISLIELALGLLTMLGIYIIFDFHPQYRLGVVFGILSAVGSALFPIFNKQLLQHIRPASLSFYEFLGALLWLCFILPLYHRWFPLNYFWPSAMDWLWLLLLSVFCTVLMFLLQLNALNKISAFTSNLSFNLEPLYSIVLAFILFDEGSLLRTEFFIGLGLIVLAVLCQTLLIWQKQKKRALPQKE